MYQFFIRHWSFIIVFSIALLSPWGCHKKSPANPPPEEPKTPPPIENTPSAITPRVPTLPKPAPSEPISLPKAPPKELELGEADFQAGKYPKAAMAFESFLSAYPNSEGRDKALFYLGLSRALADNTGRNMRQTDAAFKKLISEFPNSPYKIPSEFILGLQSQIEKLRSDVKEREEKIKKLSEELQKLKEIDLQRRPSRPLE
jgi:tetratricopeptide (TPR) repeat protein